MRNPKKKGTVVAWTTVALLVMLATSSWGQSVDQDADSAIEPLQLASRDVPDPVGPVPVPSEAVGQEEDYRVGKQDLLEIRVFGLDELAQTVRVSGDGFISLPLLGRVRAEDLTKSQLERRIAELLDGRYVHDPQVTVFVKEYESKKIAISGAVQNPGRYEMLGSKSLLDMISLAGGLRDDHARQLTVFRASADGETRPIPVDLERLIRQGDPSLNLFLRPGDIVYVPTLERIRIFVGGAVNNPNMFEIPKSDRVTLMRAITLAGGTTDRADKKVKIIRNDGDGRRVSFIVDYRQVKRGKAEDPILKANDLVFVEESFF